MEISKLTEGQALDMGIVDAAIKQAERHAAGIKPLDPTEYADAAQLDAELGVKGYRFYDTEASRVLHAEALELNAQAVYIFGHGTRAYRLEDVVRYDDGTLMYSVRPLSGGMEWTYDRWIVSTVPFEA